MKHSNPIQNPSSTAVQAIIDVNPTFQESIGTLYDSNPERFPENFSVLNMLFKEKQGCHACHHPQMDKKINDTIAIMVKVQDSRIQRSVLKYYRKDFLDRIPLDAIIALANSDDGINKLEMASYAEHMIFYRLITADQFISLISSEDGINKFKAISTQEVKSMIDYRLIGAEKAIEIVHFQNGIEILNGMSKSFMKNIHLLVPRAGIHSLIDNSISCGYPRIAAAHSR